MMRWTLHSEWTKLAALRAIRWSLILTVVLTVALTLLVTGTAAEGTETDPLQLRLAGAYLGQMAVVALGVLAIGSEFTSGMIRTTFVATPRRHRVLAAKAAVVGGLVLAAGLGACGLSYGLGGDVPGVSVALAVRGIAGTAVYYAALALLSLAIGTILRHSAAAISIVFALLWVPLIVINLVPMETGLKIARLCPMFAGLSIQRTVEVADSIPIAPGVGLALVCGYAATALALAFWLIGRRDA